MIYFTADPHFGHTNIIRYCNRPFRDKNHMDEMLIKNWNDVVLPRDTVYVLGDFTLSSDAQKYIDRLTGDKKFLAGSHDQNWFGKATGVDYLPPLYSLDLQGKYSRGGYALTIVLCHYAMRKWDISHHGSYHLYGHSHGRITDPITNSMDVGVDSHNFYPIPIDWILDVFKAQA